MAHLVGDIGATNARFALVDDDGSLAHFASFLCEDYLGIGDAIDAYLSQANAARPTHAALAVATTPNGDSVSFTNNPWAFSIDALTRRFGFSHLTVVNDFHANALALPHLSASDVMQVGGGTFLDRAPKGVIGPGSGLGVAACVWDGERYMALAGEGGHVTMPPADETENEVLALLRRRFDHVSAERVLSGPGLVHLYEALCEVKGQRSPGITAAQITDAATAERDVCAAEAVAMFCAMLGTVAGNLALTIGARGGIYIAGGIVPRLGVRFAQSPFRARFEDKGRFRDYLAGVPTSVIVRHDAALLGAAALLAEASTST